MSCKTTIDLVIQIRYRLRTRSGSHKRFMQLADMDMRIFLIQIIYYRKDPLNSLGGVQGVFRLLLEI